MRKFLLFTLLLLGIMFVGCVKELSSEKELLSFDIPNQSCHVFIEGTNVSVYVYRQVDISKLVPMVTVSKGARVYPYSGATVNFTNPVTYNVIAPDGSIATYKVTVYNTLSRLSDIQVFKLVGTDQIFERAGDSLFIYVPYETDITNIETFIIVSDSVNITPISGTYMNFTSPQTYTTTSTDGTSRNYVITVKKSPWRKVGNGQFSRRDEHTVLVFKDKMWLLGGWIGNDNHAPEVWNTSDGINWNLVTNDAPWKDKKSANFVVFDDKIYALGGVGDDLGVWISSDGLTWNKILANVPWGKRYHPYVAVFKNKIWVMGGISVGFDYPRPYGVDAFSDVWSSLDGITWQQEKEYSQWTARGLVHGYAVLNNELFLYSGGIKGTSNLSGGLETLSEYNDVWKTSDGINWIRLTNTSNWAPRTHSNVTVYQNKLWLFAGSVGRQSNLSNEVWTSTDGKVWEQVKHSFFSPRHASSAVEFNGKLYLVAGFFVNDVWVLENY
jgi:hypothetical protein